MATFPSPTTSDIDVWTDDEVQTLIETIRSLPGNVADIPAPLWWRGLILVLLETGSSVRDVMHVRRCQVDLKSPLPIGQKRYELHVKTVEAIAEILPHQCKYENDKLFPWDNETKPGGIFYRALAEIVARAGITSPPVNMFWMVQQTAKKSKGLLDRLDLSKPSIANEINQPSIEETTPATAAGETSDGEHAGRPAHYYVTAVGTRNLNGIPHSEFKLSEAWEHLVLPDRDKASDSTLIHYIHVLNAWKRLTNDPPVSEITRRTVVDFREKLQQTPFLRGKRLQVRSVATVNRIIRELHVMVSPLFPADRYYPGGLGLTPIFAFPKALPQKKVSPFVFNENQLSRLYLQADACERTIGCRETGVNNPRLWRAGLVLALNCAARTFDLFNLRWQDVILGESGRFRFGSIQFEARKTGKLQRIPLNQCAAQHLADLSRRPADDSDRVFPGFNKTKTFYVAWRKICRSAEVDAVFEDMRKTSVTWHNNLVWNAGFWLSGHLQPGVMGNYDNPSERVFEAVYRLENPIAFTDGASKLRTLERFRPVSYRK